MSNEESYSTPIFQDLEIDTEGFLDPTKVQDFSQKVLSVARELEKILDRVQTVSIIEDAAKKEYEQGPDNKAKFKEMFDELINGLYETGETMELPILYGLSEALIALGRDLKTTLHDRAKSVYVNEVTSSTDKKLAQIQHKRLRNAFETYAAMVKLLHGVELPKIKAKPGNFQSSVGKTRAFQFADLEDPMYNPRAVARKLGIFYEGILFSDVIEWLDENDPDQKLVKIVEIDL